MKTLDAAAVIMEIMRTKTTRSRRLTASEKKALAKEVKGVLAALAKIKIDARLLKVFKDLSRSAMRDVIEFSKDLTFTGPNIHDGHACGEPVKEEEVVPPVTRLLTEEEFAKLTKRYELMLAEYKVTSFTEEQIQHWMQRLGGSSTTIPTTA